MKILARGLRYTLKQAPDGTLRFQYAPTFAQAHEVPTLAEVAEPYRSHFADILKSMGATVTTVKIPDLPWIADKLGAFTMTHPTCPQCDCVAGCQSRERLCPNLAELLPPLPRASYYEMGHAYSADQMQAYTRAAIAQPEQRTEQNFCARCGKRLVDDGIHTCTPPKDKP